MPIPRSTTGICRLRASVTRPRARLRRNLLTLAIESSCDDTCVAILEKNEAPHSERPLLQLLHHEKVTSNNLAFKGVHPITALEGHQENLARLVCRSIDRLPKADEGFSTQPSDVIQISPPSNDGAFPWNVRKPDFITVTRGPGMRSNLNVGLDLAKGLAVAWNRPLVGVNHMHAHALTPRLVNAMVQAQHTGCYEPPFPFLSLLISGGHTMLIHSTDLTEHEQLASTVDIAIGDAIDKIARDVLPDDVTSKSTSTMYGPALEQFAFPRGSEDHNYDPLSISADVTDRYTSPVGWSLAPLLAVSRAGARPNQSYFSFTGLASAVKRAMDHVTECKQLSIEVQLRELAVQAMRLAFEHLASRVCFALKQAPNVKVVVVSGGVASNQYLRIILRKYLDHRDLDDVKLLFPPIDLCVDNAVMIGWTGIEMFEQGWHSDLSIKSLRKWTLDSRSADGGILGASGWLNNKIPPIAVAP